MSMTCIQHGNLIRPFVHTSIVKVEPAGIAFLRLTQARLTVKHPSANRGRLPSQRVGHSVRRYKAAGKPR